MNISKVYGINEKRKCIDGTYNVDGFIHFMGYVLRTHILRRFHTTDITNQQLQQYLAEERENFLKDCGLKKPEGVDYTNTELTEEEIAHAKDDEGEELQARRDKGILE